MSKTNQTLQDVLYELAEEISDLEGGWVGTSSLADQPVDQALKEISELLVECKPEWKTLPLVNGECPENAQDFILATGYNEALYDYEKNIKARLQ